MPAGRIGGRRPDAVFEVARARAGRGPAASVHGRAVMSVRLCEYVEHTDGRCGPYSLITAVVETDAGTSEMLYDEGYMGRSALADAGRFLVMHLGASALVERSIAAIVSRGAEDSGQGARPRNPEA